MVVPRICQSVCCKCTSNRLTKQEDVFSLTLIDLSFHPSNNCFSVLLTYRLLTTLLCSFDLLWLITVTISSVIKAYNFCIQNSCISNQCINDFFKHMGWHCNPMIYDDHVFLRVAFGISLTPWFRGHNLETSQDETVFALSLDDSAFSNVTPRLNYCCIRHTLFMSLEYNPILIVDYQFGCDQKK